MGDSHITKTKPWSSGSILELGRGTFEVNKLSLMTDVCIPSPMLILSHLTAALGGASYLLFPPDFTAGKRQVA